MRLPLTPQLSTKDGATNKNARLTNMLREKDKAVVRPGLSLVLDYAGVGNGLVPFNDHLIGLFDDTVYDLDAMGTASPGVSDGVLDLTTVDATPVALGIVDWDVTFTYPLGWKVISGGDTYTSLANENAGNTPAPISTWWLGTGGGGYTLNAEESDIETSFGYNSDEPYGSLNPLAFLSGDVLQLFSNDAPYTRIAVDGSYAQDAFISMTIDAVTVDTEDAVFTDVGGVTTWQWNGTMLIPAAGNYTVTFT